MSKAFMQAKAVMDVIRYEEADRLFKQLYQLEKDVKSASDEDNTWWHKYEDRPLSQAEVYCRALDDVMNMIDERLGVLTQ
jgi:hypothetical protein